MQVASFSANESSVTESTVNRMMATVANDYAALLLYERSQDLFSRIAYHYSPRSQYYNNKSIGIKATHILAVLSFAEGNLAQVIAYFDCLPRKYKIILSMKRQITTGRHFQSLSYSPNAVMLHRC